MHVEWPRLALDAILLAAVGIVAALAALVVSQTVIDATIFQAGLSYSSTGTVAHPDLKFDVISDVRVADPGASGGAAHSDLEDSIGVTGWSYPSSIDRSALAHLLGANLLAGSAEISGVVLDQATAERVGADVGSTIYLDQIGNTTLIECRVRVAGVIRPYRAPDSIQTAGLAVFPESSCEGMSAAAASVLGYNLHHVEPRGTAKWPFTLEVLRNALGPQISGALVPLIALGLLFWGLTAVRIATRLRSQLTRVMSVLHEQGVSSRRLRSMLGAGLIVICCVVGLVSLVVAHFLLFKLASFWTQWLQVWTLEVFLILDAIVVAAITYRSARWVAQEVES